MVKVLFCVEGCGAKAARTSEMSGSRQTRGAGPGPPLFLGPRPDPDLN